MKSALKIAMVMGLLALTSSLVKAQNQKMGDNLGNHVATKDLQLAGKQILNASGVVIGTTVAANESVALQIGSTDKAILVSNVAANADILTPLNGMIVYNTNDNKFYLYQNSAWVTFALALKASPDGISTTPNLNGYELTEVGQETILKLTPADESNPGVVTTGAQKFGGNKSFLGNVDLGPTATLTVADGATNLGGALNASGITTLTGTVNTNPGFIITNALAAENTADENVLVIDAITGAVKKSAFVANALLKQQIAVPTVSLGVNEATKIVLSVAGVLINDGIVVNYDAAELAATAGLEFISILNATATGTNQVTVTVADLRQENADGTPLVSAATLLAGKKFTVTRYRQTL